MKTYLIVVLAYFLLSLINKIYYSVDNFSTSNRFEATEFALACGLFVWTLINLL